MKEIISKTRFGLIDFLLLQIFRSNEDKKTFNDSSQYFSSDYVGLNQPILSKKHEGFFRLNISL